MPKVKGQKSSKVMLSKKEAKAVRGLIQGDTKYGPVFDVGPVTLGTTRSYCVTGGGAPGTAARYSGEVSTSNDSAFIKSIEIDGYMEIAPLAKAAGSSLESSVPVTVRELLVWFYKPSLPASAAGTLPPVTEVLLADTVASMYVDDNANAGRFKVLSDKRYKLGSNVYVTNLSLKETTISRIYCPHKIMIGKTQHYAAPAVPGAAGVSLDKGGHYDSDVDEGQVTRGLCVLYYVSEGDAGTFAASLKQRLCYVA